MSRINEKHEEFIRGTAVELKTLCEEEELKGEMLYF